MINDPRNAWIPPCVPPESSARYEDADVRRLWEDDGLVAAYLEWRQHVVADAVKMIDESFHWRKELSVNGTTVSLTYCRLYKVHCIYRQCIAMLQFGQSCHHKNGVKVIQQTQ